MVDRLFSLRVRHPGKEFKMKSRLASISITTFFTAALVLAPAAALSAAPARVWTKAAPNGMSGDYAAPPDHCSSVIVYDSNLYAGTGEAQVGGDVYRLDGGAWTRVAEHAFGNERNRNMASMAVFGGKLYVGTYNLYGCEVWSYDGKHWSRVGGGGLGNEYNWSVESMAVYGGKLYCGVWNATEGCGVWRYDGGTSWTQVNTPGFGDASVVAAQSMAEHQGKLYVGTVNKREGVGGRLYCYDGTGWSQVGADGFGDVDVNGFYSLFSMEPTGVDTSMLFIGTGVDFNESKGCGLYAYDSDTGDPPTMVVDDGFGDVKNSDTTSLCFFHENLYAGTMNFETGAGIFRWDGTNPWEKVTPDVFSYVGVARLVGMGPSLYAGCHVGAGESAVLRYSETGTDWAKIGTPGWVTHLNFDVSSLALYKNKLHAGTTVWTLGRGCEVWRHDGGSWSDVASGGLGEVSNDAVSAMCVDGDVLYAGTDGQCCVYRYTGGIWQQINTYRFGKANNVRIVSLCTLDGRVYAGTGTSPGGVSGEVWAYDGSTWSQVNENGFGTTANEAGLAVFDGTLYAWTDWGDVWRYDNPGWTQVNENGFGKGLRVTCLRVYGGRLYASAWSSSEVLLWRYDGGTFWTQVSGNFKDTGNSFISSMEVFDGRLFLGTHNTKNGCELWSYDGIGWTRENRDGFAEGGANYHVSSMAAAGNTLYCGVQNPDYGSEIWKTTVSAPAVPSIDHVDPGRGHAGQVVNLHGHGFGAARSGSYVMLGGLKVTDVISWSNGLIKVRVPGVGPGAKRVSVTTAGGTSNSVDFNVLASAWYLPEGSTAWGFDTYVTIVNPNGFPVNVQVTCMTPGGSLDGGTYTMRPETQLTINQKDLLGEADFSTKVECLEGESIAVDRTMSWPREAHNSIGVNYASSAWYLPEGCSGYGFETWTLVQNPGDQEATVTLTYMTEGSGPVSFEKRIPARSRRSFDMRSDIGEQSASVEVMSDVQVIAERSMYRYDRMEGHDSIGTTCPSTDYSLAEGTTAWGFETWLLVQNPGATDSRVDVTYMTPGGPVEQERFTVPAKSRKSVKVNDVPGMENTDCSIRVHGSSPILAERSMYWNNGVKEACHDSIGVPSASRVFFLPDGQTSKGRETYTLVQNPNSKAVDVRISYLTSSGQGNFEFTESVPAYSRRTFKMGAGQIPGRAGVVVECVTAGKKIIVERSMYWNSRGAGTVTVGGGGD